MILGHVSAMVMVAIGMDKGAFFCWRQRGFGPNDVLSLWEGMNGRWQELAGIYNVGESAHTHLQVSYEREDSFRGIFSRGPLHHIPRAPSNSKCFPNLWAFCRLEKSPSSITSSNESASSHPCS